MPCFYTRLQKILQYIKRPSTTSWGDLSARLAGLMLKVIQPKANSDHIWGGRGLKIDRYVGILPWWCFGFQPNFLGLLNQVIMAKPVVIYLLHGMFVCVQQFVLCLYFNPPKRLGGKTEDVNNPFWLTVCFRELRVREIPNLPENKAVFESALWGLKLVEKLWFSLQTNLFKRLSG